MRSGSAAGIIGKFRLLLPALLIALLAGCGNLSAPMSFEDRSENFAASTAIPTLEECFRYIQLDDAVARPKSRDLDPVEPLSVENGTIVGSLENLPDHGSSLKIASCEGAIGSPAVAVGDLNKDGFDDIVKMPNQIWMNNGTGSFTLEELPVARSGEGKLADGVEPIPTFERWPGSPAIFDVDNDGTLEIISAFRAGPTDRLLNVYRQTQVENGNGEKRTVWAVDEKFPLEIALPPGILATVQSVSVTDINNDGWNDVILGFFSGHSLNHANYVAGFQPKGMMVLLNVEGQKFVDVSEKFGVQAAITKAIKYFKYQGSLAKLRYPRTLTHAIGTADLDNDGFVDLVVAGDYGTGIILWNDSGRGYIYDPTVPFLGHSLMGPAFADVNKDGYLDIFVSQVYSDYSYRILCIGGRPCDVNETLGNFWYVSKGPRSYENQAIDAGLLDGRWGWGATFVDFDNDGYEELIQAAGYPWPQSPAFMGWENRRDRIHLWTQVSPGSLGHEGKSSTGVILWEEVGTQSGVDLRTSTGGLVVGDFDRDGRIDIVTASGERTVPYLLRNTTNKTGNWIEITAARGTAGLSEAGNGSGGATVAVFGARVVVSYTDGEGKKRKIMRVSGTQSQSYFSNSSSQLWFGVGDAEKVDVSIDFPDGSQKRWENLPTSRSHTLSQ